MYKCEECGLEFETFQSKANHYRWKHLGYAFKNIENKELFRAKRIKQIEDKFGKFIKDTFYCKNCGDKIEVIHRENKKVNRDFCSTSCANRLRIRTEESKRKTSLSVKNAWIKGKYDTDSYYEKQSKNKKFSSKIERNIVKYFKTTYPEHEWKSGGRIIFNGVGISRDLYSDILKICIEYDGIWHFKDINNQLNLKQYKDDLLEQWCILNNYRLIRIDENDFKGVEQIEDLIFNNINPIIKIGKRY